MASDCHFALRNSEYRKIFQVIYLTTYQSRILAYQIDKIESNQNIASLLTNFRINLNAEKYLAPFFLV